MGSSSSSFDSETLSDEDLTILLNNSLYTKELILEWHQNFLKDCPKGRLTRDMLLQSLQKCRLGGHDVNSYVDRVFNTFDVDCRGYIDFVEFLTALSITMKGSVEDKLKLAFGIYDYDGHNRVTRREAARILQSIEKLLGSGTSSTCTESLLDRLFISKKYATKDEFTQACLDEAHIHQLLSATPRFA